MRLLFLLCALALLPSPCRADAPAEVVLRNGKIWTLHKERPKAEALAVRAGDPVVVARDAETLRATFLAADAIFVPDTKTSTAGIHVASVLAKLRIADEVRK